MDALRLIGSITSVFTGASSSIIHSGWNELLLRIGIGILFSIVLILLGFKGQGIITPHKQTKPAL